MKAVYLIVFAATLASAAEAKGANNHTISSSSSSSYTYRCRGLESWGGEHTYHIPKGEFCTKWFTVSPPPESPVRSVPPMRIVLHAPMHLIIRKSFSQAAAPSVPQVLHRQGPEGAAAGRRAPPGGGGRGRGQGRKVQDRHL